jgi:hypothetical protein
MATQLHQLVRDTVGERRQVGPATPGHAKHLDSIVRSREAELVGGRAVVAEVDRPGQEQLAVASELE